MLVIKSNKEKKKQQRRERYQKQKELAEQEAKEQTSKYYVMSLKEYTELNQEKRKRWLDFIWTFKDLNKIGISNIIEVMRIRELVENLINDYWETARNEIKKGKSWDSLDQEQKDLLIKKNPNRKRLHYRGGKTRKTKPSLLKRNRTC